MDADPTQRGVIAKRRLLGDFHSPVPATPAAARVKRNAADSIRRATSVAFLPSVRLYETRGQGSGRVCPPTKTPVTMEAYLWSGGRPTHAFLPTVTAGRPQSRQPPLAGRTAGRAAASLGSVNQVAAPLSVTAMPRASRINLCIQIRGWVGRPRPAVPAVRAGTADGRTSQLACRRKNAGMSS